MGFMVPVAERFAAYRVETNCGTETVPEDACGTIDVDMANASEAELEETFRVKLAPYVEGSRILGDIERTEGWFARLSAPGYLDCTEWSGPFATAEEALTYVKDLYDVDDEGDDANDDE